MLVYRKCNHWEDREDTEWRIESDALVRRDVTGNEQRWPWKDISVVWPHWISKQRKGVYHMTSIWITGEEANRCDFDAIHVVTVGEYEQRVEDYNAFLKAVLTTMVAKSPNAEGWLGSHRVRFKWEVTGAALFAVAALWLLLNSNMQLLGKVALLGVSLFAAFSLYRQRPRAMSTSQLLQELKL